MVYPFVRSFSACSNGAEEVKRAVHALIRLRTACVSPDFVERPANEAGKDIWERDVREIGAIVIGRVVVQDAALLFVCVDVKGRR